MDNLDLMVLRALARLSRMRKAIDCEALALRAGGSLEEVRGALGRLARAQMVERSVDGSKLTLTMMGLAVAVAVGAPNTRQGRARVAATVASNGPVRGSAHGSRGAPAKRRAA
jgi:hypothetical protein